MNPSIQEKNELIRVRPDNNALFEEQKHIEMNNG